MDRWTQIELYVRPSTWAAFPRPRRSWACL